MFNNLWHTIIVNNYIKCGIRYGIDRETYWQTGDDLNLFYIKTYIFWSKQYHKLGFRLIDDDVWQSCTYNKKYYVKHLNIPRF